MRVGNAVLRGDKSAPLYSATKQQADRLLRRLKGRLKPGRNIRCFSEGMSIGLTLS